MIPKIKNALAWEQTQKLMQPAYIRVVDNLRKAIEDSSWRESYQEVQTPLPGYELSLSSEEKEIKINLWELCFEVCFQDYQQGSVPLDAELTVDVDTSLLTEDTGEVNWERLDEKAMGKVEQLLENLN
ncbi:hypothetical protein [Dactylococcopsis salina]|uniref:Uncharacterized protein n=1 Tax=Dactylococcopsis salina (strain PCC 8305) TaxID=13035 RepID=K9YWF1_DACS8|nr:hypothetical protein [Dactylococcopsis salina]AFZ50453.1 hypothetical protein Dacsa_1795 [Dactylococcopsis salina PCC 8305]